MTEEIRDFAKKVIMDDNHGALTDLKAIVTTKAEKHRSDVISSAFNGDEVLPISKED
jgi:hypothetical protein